MIWRYHAPFSAGTTMNISRFAADRLNALVVNHVGRVSDYIFVSLQDPLAVFFESNIQLSLCAIAWED